MIINISKSKATGEVSTIGEGDLLVLKNKYGVSGRRTSSGKILTKFICFNEFLLVFKSTDGKLKIVVYCFQLEIRGEGNSSL